MNPNLKPITILMADDDPDDRRLTKEAFALYLHHLEPTGILAVHVSNSYLNLAPVVAQGAAALGKQSRLISNGNNSDNDESSADWVLVADPSALARLRDGQEVGSPVAIRPDLRLWADDYSSLTQIIKTSR